MGDSPRNVLDNSYQSMRSHHGMSQNRINQDQIPNTSVPGNQQNTQQMFDMFSNMMKMMMQQNGQSPTNFPNPSQLQNMMNQQKLPGVPSNTNLMNAPQINSSTGNVLDSSFRNFEDRFNHQQTDLLDFYEKMGKQPQSLSPIPGASNQQGYSRQNQREGQNTKINQRDQLGRQQLYQQQQQPNSFELSATSEQLPFKSDFVDYDFQNQSQNISAIANNPSTYSQKPSRNPRDKDLEEAINSRNYGNNQAYGRYDYKQDERNNNDFNQRKGYQDNYQRNDEQQQQDLAQSLSPSASKQRNNDFNYQRNNNQKGQTRGEDQSQKNLDYNSGLGFGQKYSTDHNYPQIEKDFIPKNQGNTFQDDKNFSKRQQQFQQPYDDEPARDYRNFAERGNDYYDFKPKNKQVEDFEIGNQSGKRNRDWGYENEFLRDSMQFNNNSSNLQGDQQFNQNQKNQQSMKQQQGIQKSNITTAADDRLFNDEKNDSENGKPFNQKPQLNNQNLPLNDEDRPIKAAKNNNYTSYLQNKNSSKEFSDGDSVVVVSSKSRNTGFSSGLPDEREEIPRETPEEHRINPFEEIPIKTNGGSKRFEDLIEEQLQQEEGQHNNEGEDWHDAGEKRPKNFLKKGTRSFLSNAQQRSKAASNHIETINTQQAGDTLDSTVVVPFTKPKSKKSALPSGKGTTLPPGSSISARNTLSSNNMAASSVQLLNKPSKQSLNYNQSQAGFENTNTNSNNSQHNQNSAPELDLGDTPTDAGNGQKAKKKFLQRGKGKGGGIQGATSSSNIQNKKEEEKQNKEINEKPSQSSQARPKTSTKVETYDLISVDSGSKNQSEDEGYAKNKSYQPNRYLKQEEQEGERNKGVLQFDDEEEWGDTAAQKKKEIKKRTQSGQQQQVRSGEDQDEHEETNDAYDYDENNDQEQYSKVVQKYFNKKPSQKQAQSTSQGESEKQFDPSKPNIEEYTNEQIEKLNAEISKFKLENERVRKMRAKYEDLLKSFTKEKEQFAKQKEIEVQELEEWKKEEQKKIRNEKRIAERQQKASANMPNRKEREEIEGYKATIKKLQDEIKMKDSRNKLAMERTKKQLEEQVARNQELLDEIREMEKARVDLSKNGLKSQSNQLSSRVQQPQVKSTTSRDERSISSLSKKNQKQNSAADFQFDNNTAWKRDKNNEFQAQSENWIRNGDQEEEDVEETYEKYQGEVEENSQSQDDEEDDYRGKGKGQKGKHMKERSSSQPNVDFDEEEEEEFKNGGGNQDEHDGQEDDDEEIEKYEDIINFNPTNHINNNMNMNSQGNSYNRAKTEQSKHTAIINNTGPNSQRQLLNSKNSTVISNNTNISNNNSLLNKSSSASKNNNIHQNNNISNRSANQTTNYIPTTTNSALPNSKSNNPPPALKKNNLPSQLDKKGQNPKWKYDLTQLSKIDNIGIAMINRDIDINQFNYNGNPLYKEYTSIYSQVGKIIQQNNTQDGKIQREFENGTIEVTFPNKVRRQILKNGLTIIEFVNSDVKQVLPDQTIIYYFADAGTTQITLPSAVNIYKFPNDQIEIHFPSGKKEIKFCDGTARYVFEDGVEKTYFPDGSVQTVDINRIKTITHANGNN